ncbi:MAG: hypothetical protein B0D92_08195 [Spirochaeta sp. LUC14_002_19_P3]|nr:MAG: hypothetical protein B0D92_08195 [Spirochaeta sp. LUC14_002_19_P3]
MSRNSKEKDFERYGVWVKAGPDGISVADSTAYDIEDTDTDTQFITDLEDMTPESSDDFEFSENAGDRNTFEDDSDNEEAVEFSLDNLEGSGKPPVIEVPEDSLEDFGDFADLENLEDFDGTLDEEIPKDSPEVVEYLSDLNDLDDLDDLEILDDSNEPPAAETSEDTDDFNALGDFDDMEILDDSDEPPAAETSGDTDDFNALGDFDDMEILDDSDEPPAAEISEDTDDFNALGDFDDMEILDDSDEPPAAETSEDTDDFDELDDLDGLKILDDSDELDDLDSLKDSKEISPNNSSKPLPVYTSADSREYSQYDSRVHVLEKGINDLKEEIHRLRDEIKQMSDKSAKEETDKQDWGFFEDEDNEIVALTDEELDNVLDSIDIIEHETEDYDAEPDGEYELNKTEETDTQAEDVISIEDFESPGDANSPDALKLEDPFDDDIEVLDMDEYETPEPITESDAQDEAFDVVLGESSDSALELDSDDSIVDIDTLKQGETFDLPDIDDEAETEFQEVATSGAKASPVRQENMKEVMEYMNQLLEYLPNKKYREFTRSRHFDAYNKMLEELGISG